MDDCLDVDADIYKDLPDFRYDETIDKLNAIIAKLEAENSELHSKLVEMKKEKGILESTCGELRTNITSLLKTAKLELQRKERTINDLRQQLNETARQSKRFGVKRHFENKDRKPQNAEIKDVSKKDSQTCEPASKKPRLGESDKLTNHLVSKNEESTNGNMSSLKPPLRVPNVSQKENVPLTSSQRVTPGELDTVPQIAAPSLPIIDCPTVFSARMYQRLYNKSATRTGTLPSVTLIPTNDEEQLKRVTQENKTEQQKCAIESEKKVSEASEDAVKLPCTPSFPPKLLIPAAVSDNVNSTTSNNDKLKFPPHLKGKSSSRKMFVPISNTWNCMKPPSSVPADETPTHKSLESVNTTKGEVCSEVSRVTSELTVKIDNERSDERRELELDVFGSPVKWADDCSSDSVKVDGPAIANRKKILYNIFGSPYKNGDSCSSEAYNFVLPLGAYEDSCWTNQPPDKASPRPIKPPTPSLPDSSNNLSTSKDKSSEFTSGSHDRDDGKKAISLPPPVHPIGKKNQSVFSPLKDSKTATSLPSMAVDDRSSTGVCFPFKAATRYEDSVLGQFDDTAQFVSALAKVDTKLSPLSTPFKNPDPIDESLTPHPKTVDSLPINSPISFKEVFQNKLLQDVSIVATVDSSIPSSGQVATTEPHASTSLGMESSLAPEKSQQNEENATKLDEEVGVSDTATNILESPSTLSSSKFIHRSNFSCSSVFTMSSDSQSFLDKPLNVLQPRKKPRMVANNRSPIAPNGSCKDIKLNPRIAIPDSFITEQEERVRLWQKNHLYETTLRSSYIPKISSPSKSQVKIHSHSNDLKSPGHTRAQSKTSSPGKNRKKTSTSSKDVDVVNRLQPKRFPRHPVNPVSTVVKPEEVTAAKVDDPPRAINTTIKALNMVKSVVDNSVPKPEAIDTTIKALNMIKSVVDNSVPKPEASAVSGESNKDEETVDVLPVDAVHIKTVPVGKAAAGLNFPKIKDLVVVTCKQRSSTYVQSVSQIKRNTPQSSISKLRVSNISVSSSFKGSITTDTQSSISISPTITIKKPLVRRESDFKRSSALKKTGDTAQDHAVGSLNQTSDTTEGVVGNTSKDHLPSRPRLIRRKSAPNLHVSSQNTETRVTSRTPTKASSSTCLIEKTKVDTKVSNLPIVGPIETVKWVVHPIELDIPQNIYEFIKTSFTNNDPRSMSWDVPDQCPRLMSRPVKTRIPHIVEDQKDAKEDNLNVKTVCEPNIENPNEFSLNVTAISRAGGECSIGTRPIVTSTPFPAKSTQGSAPKKQLSDEISRQVSGGRASCQQRVTLNETISSKPLMETPVVKRNSRAAGRTSILLDAPVKMETRSRGRKRLAETQPELISPKENCKEPTKKPGSWKCPKSPKSSVADAITEAPLAAEGVIFTSAISPKPKSVVLNESSHVSWMMSPSQSVTSTVQPLLISRKRRNPNFSSVTVVHSGKPVLIPRKRKASFTVSNSST